MRGVQERLLTIMIIKVVRHGPMLTAIKWSGFMQTERTKIFTILKQLVQIVFMDVWLIDRYPGVDYEYESQKSKLF